jgi:hypothetical protein
MLLCDLRCLVEEAMIYKPYHELDSTPNIIVDGAAGPGTVLTLSHWPHSGTPAALRRDTSTEIVFAYLDAPATHVYAEYASNNHFDEDGLLGIYALIDPEQALKHRDLILDAARAGDFGVYKQRDAARIAFTISAYADPSLSPLPASTFALPYLETSAALYRELLELLPRMIANISEFRALWETEDEKLTASERLIDEGEITIEEKPELDLAVVHVPADLAADKVHRFTRSQMAECHPFALNSRTPCTRLLIIQGQRVQFQYRYETWVQLASRRPPARVDLTALANELSRQEASGVRWKFDGVDSISPRLQMEGSAVTSISPEAIQKQLEHHLATGAPAWNPYD